MWIKRDISSFLEKNNDVIQVIRGPRQVGKTSLILHLDDSFREFSLDDPALRELAQRDPELFLAQSKHGKIFIDEAQYAPELFTSLKRIADLYKRENSGKQETRIRLTGSNQVLMDRFVKESLAGRAGFFDLGTLSVSEIRSEMEVPIQEILFKGGWPELYASSGKDVVKYLDDYISSYVEKDVVLTAGIEKVREFLRFLRLLSGRIGQLLDLASLSRETGVESNTIKSWISVLEKMQIIALVMPYSHNLSKRLIKSPKVFFLDTGLACRLQGWRDASVILTSPQQGPLFENLVFSEIHKTNTNFGLGLHIFHWRSREGEEVDFLLEAPNRMIFFIEAKVTRVPGLKIDSLPEIRKVFKDKTPPVIQCYQEGTAVLENNVPISELKDTLLKFCR